MHQVNLIISIVTCASFRVNKKRTKKYAAAASCLCKTAVHVLRLHYPSDCLFPSPARSHAGLLFLCNQVHLVISSSASQLYSGLQIVSPSLSSSTCWRFPNKSDVSLCLHSCASLQLTPPECSPLPQLHFTSPRIFVSCWLNTVYVSQSQSLLREDTEDFHCTIAEILSPGGQTRGPDG